MSSTTATRGQIEAFVGAVFDPADCVEVRVLPSARSAWLTADDVAGIAEFCIKANAAGENVYVGVNPRRGRGHRGNKGVALARCVFLDFDGKHLAATDRAGMVAEVRKRVADAWLPEPTLILFSGHGVHAYWRLAEPQTDLAAWDVLMDCLITTVGSDPGAKGADRIMRVPGLVNHKPPAALAELVECHPDRRSEWVDIACCAYHSNLPEAAAAAVDVERAVAAYTRRHRDHDASVIDAFNDVVPVAEILRSAGYDIAGHHFRRPGKSDRGFSGIIRGDRRGRLVSAHWSTNDPLNDQQFGKGTCGICDAFDVFTKLEHGGDTPAAVRAAARLLGMNGRKGVRT